MQGFATDGARLPSHRRVRLVKLAAAGLVLAFLGARDAWAQGTTLQSADGDAVLLFRDRAAMNEATALFRGRDHNPDYREQVNRLIACIVPSGTRAVITGGGLLGTTYDVQVADGPSAGCRGAVQTEFVRRDR